MIRQVYDQAGLCHGHMHKLGTEDCGLKTAKR